MTDKEAVEAVRYCPLRDAVCPHGMDCPYSIDRYWCHNEGRVTPAFAAVLKAIRDADDKSTSADAAIRAAKEG